MRTRTSFRILLVEDDHYIAKIIGLGMQTLGLPYHLDQASSAEGGFDLWDEQPYDIVLTDYNLRGKSGVKLIEELKRRGATETPMVLFTAYDSPQTRREAEAAHVDAFLTKPFLIDEFVHTTRKLLALNEAELGSHGATPRHAG
jgi:two-component system OmpR family response regulator